MAAKADCLSCGFACRSAALTLSASASFAVVTTYAVIGLVLAQHWVSAHDA
jgi:hypothetical protein